MIGLMLKAMKAVDRVLGAVLRVKQRAGDPLYTLSPDYDPHALVRHPNCRRSFVPAASVPFPEQDHEAEAALQSLWDMRANIDEANAEMIDRIAARQRAFLAALTQEGPPPASPEVRVEELRRAKASGKAGETHPDH